VLCPHTLVVLGQPLIKAEPIREAWVALCCTPLVGGVAQEVASEMIVYRLLSDGQDVGTEMLDSPC
jgi:hypothetical protein